MIYLDAFSGIAGDMTVGAFLDAGLEIAELEDVLGRLDLGRIVVRREARERNGILAAKFVVDVDASEGKVHRTWKTIRAAIERSSIDDPIREAATRIFRCLADAEATVHGVAPDEVHFHEVGALDSIADVLGAAWGWVRHGGGEVRVRALPVGGGRVSTRHGALPVPTPATAELLKGFPILPGDGSGEMVTPTGAAIVRALATPGPWPTGFRIEKIGYGAGDRELDDRPNVLRVMIGQGGGGLLAESLVLLEANVDDMSPEIWGAVLEGLLERGARDAFLTPVQMKKGRPGTMITVLCDEAMREPLTAYLLRETTTLGVRQESTTRVSVEREIVEVETRFGRVRVKIAVAPDGTRNVAPEFEDCRRLADEHDVALKTVLAEATAAALGRA